MAERKSFLLRIDGRVLDQVKRWADADLRSLNAQIEFLLRDSLDRAGRWKGGAVAEAETPGADRDNTAPGE